MSSNQKRDRDLSKVSKNTAKFRLENPNLIAAAVRAYKEEDMFNCFTITMQIVGCDHVFFLFFLI